MKPLRKMPYVAAAFLILLLSSGCSNDPAPDSPDFLAVRAVQPVIMRLERNARYIGTIHARKEITIASRVQSTLLALPYPEGAQVSRHTIVAEFDSTALKSVVDRLRAERNYWDQRRFTDSLLVEREALAHEQFRISQRAYLSAEAALQEALSNLAKTRETSPIDGIILSWFAEPGQNMMPGHPVLRIGSNDLEIHVSVVEEDIRKGIAVETPVRIQIIGDEISNASVSEISQVSHGSGRTFTVTIPIQLQNTLQTRIGNSVQVEFILQSREQALTIPVEALERRGNQTYVTLIRNSRAIKEEVAAGIEENGMIEVRFDWNGEDRVAVTNPDRLAQGDSVFVVEL